jgi:iron(III) transport system permease protein
LAIFRKPSGLTVVTTLATIFMAFLLLMPLTMMFISSVRGPFLPFGVPSAEWTLSNFQELFGVADELWKTLWTTAIYVAGAAAISMTVGWSLAFVFIRTDVPGKFIIGLLALAPFIMPPIVRAQATLLMVAPSSGMLNQLLRLFPWWSGETGPIDPFAFFSIVVIQGLLSVTFPFLMLVPILKNMDGSLEEAARTSGASPFRVLRSITVPVLWPAILGVAVLEVIFLLGSLEIPLLFGQQSGSSLFSLKVYRLLTPPVGKLPAYGLASAYGVFFLILTVVIFQVYRRATKDASERASVTGKGYRPGIIKTGRWKYLVLVILAGYFTITAILPFLSLAWGSFSPFAMEFNMSNLNEFFTWDSYAAVLEDPFFWSALWRTFIIAVTASTISVTLATVAAYVVARGKRGPGTGALDLLASSSVAIPSTIAAFAAFLFYLVTNKWLGLNGTLLVLILTYSYRVTVSYRISHGAVLQIGEELEEAAATSGASRLTKLRLIVLPLILPTTLAVWIGLFVLNAHEFTLAAFLAGPESRPLSLLLYNRIDPSAGPQYDPSEGAAMAVIFTLLIFLVGVLLRRTAAVYVGRRDKRRAVGLQPIIDDVEDGIAGEGSDMTKAAVGG